MDNIINLKRATLCYQSSAQMGLERYHIFNYWYRTHLIFWRHTIMLHKWNSWLIQLSADKEWFCSIVDTCSTTCLTKFKEEISPSSASSLRLHWNKCSFFTNCKSNLKRTLTNVKKLLSTSEYTLILIIAYRN